MSLLLAAEIQKRPKEPIQSKTATLTTSVNELSTDLYRPREPSTPFLSISHSESPIQVALSPTQNLLATLTKNSIRVRLYKIPSTLAQDSIISLSSPTHSLPVRSIGWRPDESSTDSGPILYTTTIDGQFRLWGCMIDEPDFFSLWITLNINPARLTTPSFSTDRCIPVSSAWMRTLPMDEVTETGYDAAIGRAKGGTKDDFITVFSDGSIYLTTVSNFDARPPTFLSQKSRLLCEKVFLRHQLSALRTINISTTDSNSSSSSVHINGAPKATSKFSLVGKSSRGNVVQLDLPSLDLLHPSLEITSVPRNIPINAAGRISTIVANSQGGFVALGEQGVLQGWRTNDGVLSERFLVKSAWQAGDKVLAFGNKLAILSTGLLEVFTVADNGKVVFSSALAVPLSASPIFFQLACSTLTSRTIIAIFMDLTISVWSIRALDDKIESLSHGHLPDSSPSIAAISPLSPHLAVGTGSDLKPPVVRLVAIDGMGRITYWRLAEAAGGSSESLSMANSHVTGNGPAQSRRWTEESSVRTKRENSKMLQSNADYVTALVSNSGSHDELSIWDPKESEFTLGLQFTQLLTTPTLNIEWSPNGGTLALVSPIDVVLMCSERLDDLVVDPQGWISYARVRFDSILYGSISAMSYLADGSLVVSAEDQLFLYSSKFIALPPKSTKMSRSRIESVETEPIDSHTFAAGRLAPLPWHHPQLLFQSLLTGKTKVVIKILIGLAQQLTPTGHLTPVDDPKPSLQHITIADFMTRGGGDVESKEEKATGTIFLALTNGTTRQNRDVKLELSEHDANRLLAAIEKRSLKGLSDLEHAHLALLVQTVLEIQTQQNSLDENGLRYLISMRSFFIYNQFSANASRTPSPSPSPPPRGTKATIAAPTSPVPTQPRLKFRDMVWAFHSESQDVLLEASIKACAEQKLDWSNARALGIFLWLKSDTVLARQIETVGRIEYTKTLSDVKDPITASLFYLALKKKHMVLTLWKQASGHSDQRAMLKFLINDFDEPRWKSAALKNGYALLSQRRFHFAASFFLLAGSLKDAVNVCLRQLDDFQLAIAITRAYEGDAPDGSIGPVLKFILEDFVLPIAFEKGFRWLAGWAFWRLNRRDLSIRVIVTPLTDLAASLPYKLPSIGSPMHEDPSLVLLFAQLRSWSLQTVKGAIAVPGKTEFNFILHMARVLCRMGCHVLALDLIREWEFIAPSPPSPPPLSPLASPSALRSPTRPRHALRRQSTKFDFEIPSNLPSRIPSPEPGAKEEEVSGNVEFHAVLKKVQKETKAPPEFSFDSFSF